MSTSPLPQAVPLVLTQMSSTLELETSASTLPPPLAAAFGPHIATTKPEPGPTLPKLLRQVVTQPAGSKGTPVVGDISRQAPTTTMVTILADRGRLRRDSSAASP